MKTLKTEYLITGNSSAGVACIEGIREIDKAGNIGVMLEKAKFWPWRCFHTKKY